MPVGFFWPIYHVCTVDRLVFSRRAKTAWLTCEDSRMNLVFVVGGALMLLLGLAIALGSGRSGT